AGEGNDSVDLFGRVGTASHGMIGKPATFARVDYEGAIVCLLITILIVDRVRLAHIDVETTAEDLISRTVRLVIGNQKQRTAGLHPIAHRITLSSGERGVTPVFEWLRTRRALGIRDNQHAICFEDCSRELYFISLNLIAVVSHEDGKQLVATAGRVKIVVRLIEQHFGSVLIVGRLINLSIETFVGSLLLSRLGRSLCEDQRERGEDQRKYDDENVRLSHCEPPL